MDPQEIHRRLRDEHGNAVHPELRLASWTTLSVKAAHVAEVCRTLRDAPDLAFDCLSNLSGVDRKSEETLEVYYHLFSYRHRHQIALRVATPRLDPVVPTVSHLWPIADWLEREAFDLSSLRRVVSSSAFLPEWLRREWIEWIGPDRVWEAYGGSERIVGTLISGREWLERPGSVGRVSEGRKIKIVGPDGETLPVGEIGDVYGLPPGGPGSTYHYLGAEPRRLADGWETLGDMGYLDEDGFLYLVDRRTDLVITGGANVYPAEVEGAIESHPAVLACAVIGLPDDDLGAVVHAIVQLAKPIAEDELRRHVEERLVRYKVPRRFELVTHPLKDDAGKVRRAALRAERIA